MVSNALILYAYIIFLDPLGDTVTVAEPTLFKQYFHAIIEVESNWKANAKSKTGDIGLAQINPRGALAEFNRYHRIKVNVPDLYDSKINLVVGEWYFSHLHRLFKGDYTKSVAAYNIGPGKVFKGVKNQNYVRKVQRELGRRSFAIRR